MGSKDKKINLVFTQPQQPFKCGGAPQKVMHLISAELVKAGGIHKMGFDVNMYFAAPRIFGVPYYADQLEKISADRQCNLHPHHNLVKVDKYTREATFQNTETGQELITVYDLLHAVPPHSVPAFIARSGLADESKMLEVDKHTLQHKRYPNIFGCGDAANLPTSKTASAVFSQFPVVITNVESFLNGKELKKAGMNPKPLPGH